MADEKENAAETTQVQVDTVTKAQFEELQRKFEQVVKAQSGSDKMVAELTKRLETEAEKAANAERTAEEKVMDRIAKLERETAESKAAKARAEFLSMAYEECHARGLPKTLADKYGGDPSELSAYLDEVATQMTAKIDATVKERLGGTRKPASGDGANGRKDVSKMSLAEVIALEEKGELNDMLAP